MSSPKPPLDKYGHGQPLTPEPSGAGNTYTEGDDIPLDGDAPVTRVKLGDYLSNITRVNKYNISAGSTDAPSNNDPRGAPPIYDAYRNGGSVNNAGANKTFIDEVIEGGAVKEKDFTLIGVGEYKNKDVESGELNPFLNADNVNTLYNKGVQESRGQGHTLLSSVPGNGTIFKPAGSNTTTLDPGSHPIQQKVSTILKNNRFHPMAGSPYVNDGAFSVGSMGSMGSLQKTMGRYDPNADQFLVSDLQNIGRKLMLKAVGGVPGDIDELAPLLPSFQQIGVPYVSISVSDLSAIKQTGYSKTSGGYILTSGGEGTSAGVRNEINSSDTYGNLNSYFETFSATIPLGMATAAIGSALAILIQGAVLMGLLGLIQLMPTPAPLQRNAYDARTLPLGKRQKDFEYSGFGTVRGLLVHFWGIPTLESNKTVEGGGATHWFDCMVTGLATFFGVSDIGSQEQIPDLFTNLLDPGQAGYAATIFRVINRDLEDLVNIARPLTAPSDTQPPQESYANKASAGLSLITEFGNIKSIRFLNLCAQIGDIIKVSNARIFFPAGRDIDAMPENALTRIYKSRVGGDKDSGNYDQRSVLRHGALPSLYLIPDSLKTASAQYFDAKTPYGAASALVALGEKTSLSSSGRIDQKEVVEIEAKLDAEYVPFYFQDLRTNEIIAFHAFLDNITENYSPQWNAVEGYGRMDPVQIYKNTSRSMSISFMVVSTSQEDFDEMWYSINKLVTLIYPQYSPGTSVKSPTNNKGHIMPFSQIPSASPLVRVRIGDLVRTNYSRFNLARIFGVGYADKEGGPFNITGKPNQIADVNLRAYRESIKKRKTAPTDATNAAENGYKGGDIVRVANPNVIARFAEIKKSDTETTVSLTLNQELTIKKDEIPKFGISLPDILGSETQPIYTCTLPSSHQYGGRDVYLTHSQIFLDPAWIKQLLLDAGVSPSALEINNASKVESSDSVRSFFSRKNNEIVKTFESTAGKGLAAAITSFNLDYANSSWNVGVPDSKAPMWVKVSMTFAVIHDIPPGLDSDGFNRAPIYPVGSIINGTIGPDEVAIANGVVTTAANWSEKYEKDIQKMRSSIKDVNIGKNKP